MKIYTFIIGSTDDFDSLDELIGYVEANNDRGMQNYSIFEFDCPAECSEEIVTMMGRGYAFSNDWCMDDTVSCMIEGTLDGDARPVMSGMDRNEARYQKTRLEAKV